MTPTELLQGLALGFDTFKLFPAQQAGGVGMLKALAAPFPEAKFCPTGGITRASAPEFLALPNVLCVGGSWVAPPDRVRNGDWGALQSLAREGKLLETPELDVKYRAADWPFANHGDSPLKLPSD